MGDRKVLKAMEQDLNKARAHCYFGKVLDILFEIGEFLFTEEKFDDALKRFEEISSLCTDRQLDSEVQRETYLDGLRRSVDCLIELNYLNDATQRAEKYLTLSKELKILPHIQQAYLNQARAFMYLAEGENLTVSERRTHLAMAEKMFLGSEKSLHDIKRGSKENRNDLEIPRKKASLYQNMAQFFCSTGKLDTSFYYLNLGIELARQSRDLQDVLLLLYCDAQTLYEKKNEYKLCLEYARKYLNIVEKSKDNLEEKFNCHYHMARYHSMSNNIDEAYSEIKLAKKIKNALRFELSEEAFKLQRRLKFCRVLRNKLDEEIENEDIEGLEQLGDVYCQVQAFELSNECYNTALRLLERNHLDKSDKIYDIKLSVCLNLCDSNQFTRAVNSYLELLKFLRSGVELEGKYDKMSRVARHICKCYYNLTDKSNSELYMYKANEYAASDTSSEKCSFLASQIREQENGYISADSDFADDDEQLLEFTEGIDSSSSDSGSEKTKKVPLSKQKRNAKGETKLQVAVIEGKLPVVRSLINQGYSVNVRDNNGWTPLHEAANHGHVEICKLLIDNGAKVDMVMAQTGLTPLMDAMQSHQFKCAKVLLENGAYPYFPGKIGICAADSFYELLDKEYGENNTTEEEREVFGEIKLLLNKFQRPKSISKAKTNTKVLDAHLLSNNEAQCPEIVSGGSSDEVDDVYVPPISLIGEKNNTLKADEPENAMELYEDAIRCQSRRNVLYRSKTAEHIQRSDRIKQRRHEKERELMSASEDTKLDETFNGTNEAEWVNEVRNCTQRKISTTDLDSGICSKTNSSDSTISKKTLLSVKIPQTKEAIVQKETKRSSKRVVIDDSSSSDSEKESILTNPCKRRSQDITPIEKLVQSSKDMKQKRDTKTVVGSSDDENLSAIVKDDSVHSSDGSSESESFVLSPEIGTKPKTTVRSGSPEVSQKTSLLTDLIAEKSSPASNDKPATKASEENDILNLSFDNQPLCSTFISNSTEPAQVILNRDLFRGIPPILPSVAIDLTIRYITNRTLETVFTTNVVVKDGNETVQQILERSNFKEKFDLVPRLDVKFRGKSLQLKSCAKESVLNQKISCKEELFCIVVGWELKQGIVDNFKELCFRRNESTEICDYALQIVQDCEQSKYDMLGAFQYHNPEMMLSIIDAAVYRNVKQLALTKIHMTDDHFNALGKMFASCPLLKEVKLTKNRMDIDCLKRIVNECIRVSTSNSFLYSSLQFLCLNDNFLTGCALTHIRNLFSFCNKLKVVSLARCSLNDLVADFLSDDDEFCEIIEKLDLSENAMTNEGRGKIVSLFNKHCSISF